MWYFKFVPSKEAGVGRVEEALGAADDKLAADGVTIFSYEQARKRAAEWLPTALQESALGQESLMFLVIFIGKLWPLQ